MVQFYKLDQRMAATGEYQEGAPSELDSILRGCADVVMEHYDRLPAYLREAFPREVIEPVYDYFKKITRFSKN